MRIGFIGLGMMGTPVVLNLRKAGFEVTVWNRTQAKAAAALEAGAHWAERISALSRESDVVMTMVTDAAASEAVICGKDGVLDHARPGTILIDMASIAPEMSRAIAAQAEARGVAMLDAPVTGNPKVAEAGKLGIMVGGAAETLAQVRPVLEALSAVIVHAGPSGAGSTLKLVNNLILGVAIEAVAEALVLARMAGIDPDCVRQITSVGGARTGAMETRGARMISGDFTPHFSTDNMHKDLATAVSLADRLGAATPVAGAALHVLRAARAQGKGSLDSAVVYQVLEQLSGLSGPATADRR
ncbi:MAG TPA: NAD(P)-dependent oxidoreductase [Acidisoma sp.]|uniref:NAD(P)-dependent oxidoreductase n=1 Tax=Acidisoma sp. TaxID=1872115 RepID=UPI002CD022FD|nr:NAD(P)-dependent oxidoreductase [Acidisoma sp.]HTH99583.1 NAD(P)-dependent oxidoreductase [Acidisoma sp.]